MLDLRYRNWWPFLHRLSVERRCKVVKRLYQQGRLTDWQLWDILSTHQSPIPCAEATQVYYDLGFRPHAGYPLTLESQGGKKYANATV